MSYLTPFEAQYRDEEVWAEAKRQEDAEFLRLVMGGVQERHIQAVIAVSKTHFMQERLNHRVTDTSFYEKGWE